MPDAATASSGTAKQDAIMRRAHEEAVDKALWAPVVHAANPHAPGRGVRGCAQAQHWVHGLTTLT